MHALLRSLPLLALPFTAGAQNYFTDTIPPTPFTVLLEDFATIPDSSANNPPRLSVMTADPSGRLFVNDQNGPLYHVSDDGTTVTEYLDLRDFASTLGLISNQERGFQGFAFHPNFLREGQPGYGKLYTLHSSTNSSRTDDFTINNTTNNLRTMLVEWQTSEPETIPFVAAAPARDVLRIRQPFNNHNGGNIAFSPLDQPGDPTYGALYIAMGDGGSSNDPLEAAENPANPYGAILRIDPLGSQPTNPRYGLVANGPIPGAIPEVFCYGLRNPQRFGWDVVTGNCFIADIGQNAVEEINLAANGAHYGWDIREGSFALEGSDSPAFTGPVAEYDHTNPTATLPTTINNRAVTLGEVARGSLVSNLDGMLLFADFPTGLLFVLDVDSDPLDGGQDGILELRTVIDDGAGGTREIRMLPLINETRTARSLGTTTRADIRFSLNTQGRQFILNKRDGVIRRIVPDLAPGLSWSFDGATLAVGTEGRLEASADLLHWSEIIPQPAPGDTTPITPPDQGALFLRSRGYP